MAVVASWFGPQIRMQYDGTANGSIDWDTDDIRTSLHTSTYVADKDTHDFFNDATNQVTGTGYTAYGYVHATQTVTLDTATDEIRLDLDDASWTTASFTARQAVIYKKASTDATSPLSGYVDFGADETVSAGTFSIVWDSTGVLKIDYT